MLDSFLYVQFKVPHILKGQVPRLWDRVHTTYKSVSNSEFFWLHQPSYPSKFPSRAKSLQRGSISVRTTGWRSLTSVLAGPDQVDDVGMLAQFAQHLQLSRKVSVVILRRKLWRKSRTHGVVQKLGSWQRFHNGLITQDAEMKWAPWLCGMHVTVQEQSYPSASWWLRSSCCRSSWSWLWWPVGKIESAQMFNHVQKSTTTAGEAFYKFWEYIKGQNTWPKLPSPMTSSNFMSSHSRMG